MMLECLSADEREVLRRMEKEHDVGSRIRASGHPCKHVYRFWSAGESDLCIGGSRCEVAIYLDHDDQTFTARLGGDDVIVDTGW